MDQATHNKIVSFIWGIADPHTARMAHDAALGRVMQVLLKDDTQVYKQFVENESFRRTVTDMVFAIANQ
jgi:type I restriction enzyme R subunit